ncbi:MAG: DNA polymerase III subunit gamma/tau [Gaiellales bacterium]|nr:MAG: DNA polymerase III subunit gamma/tau [Gaiellales bacterium]
MAHTTLYRKYRPASFAEVVGQEHVTRTLMNAIEAGKVSHAYMFAGSRGTGKTSTAKLLAKALNCVEGPTATPCGKCDSCVAIGAGTSLDVIEMDAASNRGIDDIREIRERVAYTPVEGRSRVYILDEAHMLTKEASNAFLKVLEEPPGHVIFVLCTTEAHRVLPTIQSRCQKFEFRRPDSGMVLDVLRRVAAAEEIEIEDAGLAAIARGSAGAFRDAIGILDQLATFCDKRIALDDVLSMLGTVESELLFEAVDIVAEEDSRGALLFLDRLAGQGRDFNQFTLDLIGHLRNIFLVQQLEDESEGILDVPREDMSRLKAQARLLAPRQVTRFIELLMKAASGMKGGGEPRLQLELAFVMMTRPQVDASAKSLLYRVEQLEEGRLVPAPKRMNGSRQAAAPSGEQQEAPAAGSEGGAADSAGGQEADAPAQQLEVSLDKITRAWSIVLTQVKKRKIPLYSLLQDSRPLTLESGVLTIGFPPESDFNRNQVDKPEHRRIIAEVLKEMTGADLQITCAIKEGMARRDEPRKKAPPQEDSITMIIKELGAEEIT